MKITALLCVIVVLTGCPATNQVGTKGMDSPIIISDGSTHLRHKGSDSDFQITNNGVIVNDSGYTATILECKGAATCPGGSAISLVKGWTMDVFDVNSVKILTINSTDNVKVVANFYAHPIDTQRDASGDTQGSDITQHDYTFKSASFSNGDGTTAAISCAASHCKLRITYHN